MDSNETRHWYKLPVPLAWLCRLDEQPAENALADAFGDRYLYAHNSIFRTVRDAAVRFGYRFSCEDTPLWRDYQAFPLATLQRILGDKTIPYLDTGTAVRRLIGNNAELTVPPGLLLTMLRPNHAFHESAHCVAHEVLVDVAADLQSTVANGKERLVLEAIFAESFANAVERLGATGEYMPLSDTVFNALNSYMTHHGKFNAALVAAASAMGTRVQFLVLFLASFEANLTAKGPTADIYDRIAEIVSCPAQNLSQLKDSTDAAFGLNTGFRENTNPMYFDWLGHRKEYDRIANSKWLDQPDHRRFARDLAARLFGISVLRSNE